MTNWATVGVPIIVAIIGIVGTSILVPTFSSVLLPQLYNKPSLNIEMFSVPFNNKLIILTNRGAIPATNLSLILTPNEVDKTIDFVTNLFSTVNVTVLPGHSLLKINRPVLINQTLVELHIKKFVNGEGSLIN
jgi:hypothetical protein